MSAEKSDQKTPCRRILYHFIGEIILCLIFVFLLALFLIVMISNPDWILNYLGLSEKFEVLKFLGITMGGILLALQALASHKRAKAMEDVAETQADAILTTENGQQQERLKNAIEHLGHKSDSVRMGGAYELFHLAQDIEDLRQTILNILCAHIRWTTGKDEYQKIYNSEPSEEIQSLLTLLFITNYTVFKNLFINLQKSYLRGLNLTHAQLQRAFLFRAQLQGAHLSHAQLQGAFLSQAQLQGAHLSQAQLQGALLPQAQLQGAHLSQAQLQLANLSDAQLQGADLSQAQLQGAHLSQAQLQLANLSDAQLQGTNLWHAQLQGADLSQAQLQGVTSNIMYIIFHNHTFRSTNEESDLSHVIFSGGLSQENLDKIINELPSKYKNILEERLNPHINKPENNQLPENSGAIIGSFTEEEAKTWISEYEKAMSSVPKHNE